MMNHPNGLSISITSFVTLHFILKMNVDSPFNDYEYRKSIVKVIGISPIRHEFSSVNSQIYLGVFRQKIAYRFQADHLVVLLSLLGCSCQDVPKRGVSILDVRMHDFVSLGLVRRLD